MLKTAANAAAVIAGEATWAIDTGDCRELMRGLPDRCVHCVTTSPPYWGLRDYKIATSEWADGWRGVLGLEPTPELFVEHLVEVFREVRRVLRDDGVCWVNLGDSYNAGTSAKRKAPKTKVDVGGWQDAEIDGGARTHARGLKTGDLVGIPWRCAFALQADGWWLRSDVVWAKPNPMPESVNGWRWEKCRVKVRARPHNRMGDPTETNCRSWTTVGGDNMAGAAGWQPCPGCAKCEPNGGLVLRRGSWRPTKAHEYVFLLAKSERYFCDAEAVREGIADSSRQRISQPTFGQQEGGPKDYANGTNANRSARKALENFAENAEAGRNLRSVWNIATAPFKEAHFATFPPALVEPCLKAGTSARGCCPECGAPWAPIVEKERKPTRPAVESKTTGRTDAEFGNRDPQRHVSESNVVGWRPTCKCEAVSCVSCGFVIESSSTGGFCNDTKSDSGPTLPQVQKEVQAYASAAKVLQPAMCQLNAGRKQEGATPPYVEGSASTLQPMQGGIQAEVASDALLQQSMCVQGDRGNAARANHNNEGVCPGPPSSTPKSRQLRLRHGASPSDGTAPGPAAETPGSRSSQKRKQGRQPHRKPGTDDEEAARQATEVKKVQGDNLPMLRQLTPPVQRCPQCDGECRLGPLPTRSCLTLDPFGGAGTTVMVARRLGLRAIAFELSEPYANMARRRVKADMPLLNG